MLREMRLASAAAVLTAMLVLPAGAAAQGSGDVQVTVSPAVAGKGSKVSVSASGQATATSQGPPNGLSLFAARGFKADLDAVGGFCSDAQRKALNCPADSKIATGSARGEATFLLQSFPFTATIEAFLMRPLQSGDIAGVAVIVRGAGQQGSGRGRLLAVGGGGPFGIELRADELPSFQAPPGASARIDKLELTVGTDRTVREKRRIKRRRARKRSGAKKTALTKKRRKKRRRFRYVRVRHSLITNPPTCGGSWPYQVRVTFPSGPEVVRDGSVACTSR